ncbi:MAG: exo-alpha-sialidase, partial [bacterium]|nr:exo-alpha-sialidase [Candidatus Colisoma equi]
IEGVPWKGKPTRVFAYYALPQGATAERKVPGIVLVHGGGGTAFHSWVRTWNARGYAAIAMDNCGGVPGEKSHSSEHPRHAWSGPNGWGCFKDEALKHEDQWMYHAVEAVVRSHTFLRNLPEVDASKIGVTGISWGGVLTSVVCGVDPRFAFAAAVYGCGNLRRHSVWTPEIGVRWDDLWDPAQYAKRCRVPTLWCTGTNDHFFPLDSLKDTVPADAIFSIKVRVPHGHPPAGDPPEIAAFADSIVRGGRKLTERKVIGREWISTDSSDSVWEKRFFVASPNEPVNATIYFENRTLEDGLVLSSSPAFRTRPGKRSPLTAPDAAHVWSTRRHEGIPSVAVSPKSGRLWATWFGGPTDCEDSNNYVILATSADCGKTWKQVLVCDPDGAGPLRAFDPQVWVAPDGKLRWTWAERKVPIREGENYRNSCLHWFGLHRRLLSVTLDADGEPREPYPEPQRIATGVMLGKPLVRSDGVWLYPISEWYDDLSGRVYETRDQGKTFTLLGGVMVPLANREFEEHNLVELKDGTLRAYMRVVNSGSRCTWQSESKDGGRTWSKPGPCAFMQTSSRRFVRRLKGGALLLVKNGPLDKNVGRNDMTAYVSDDDGATWAGGLLLHKGPCSYPDGDQAADGSIYVIYDTERTGNRVNSLARFTEADVRAGKVVSESSDLGLKVDVRK